ncbi:MAG: polymer-forming cytoskeletal protein [Hyphomicrobium sp.]
MLPNFKKTESDSQRPTIPGPSAAVTPALGTRPSNAVLRSGVQSAPSVIGPDLLVTGNLISNGQLQVDGEVQGDIHSTHVVVGERARVTGGIIADEVVIRGHVLGSVRGKRVLLQTSSHVEGDVYHQTLAIEQGAFFEGKSRRTSDPTAGIIRPSAGGMPAGRAGEAASDALVPELVVGGTSTFGTAPDQG